MNDKQTIDWGEVSKAASSEIKTKRRVWPYVVLMLLFAGVAAWFYMGEGDTANVAGNEKVTFKVKRGDLRISVLERGSLDALNSTNIRSEVEGMSTIIKLVPEGTYVSMGDVLVELETSEYKDKLNQQEIGYQRALADFLQAQEAYNIQQSQNDSDINAATLELEFAAVDLRKYVDGEWPQQRAKAEADVSIASEEVQRAKDKVEWTRKLYNRDFATRSELEADELAHKKRVLDYDQSVLARDVLIVHSHPKELRRLQAAVVEAKAKLDRVRARSISEIAQKDAEKAAKKSTLGLQQEQLDKLKSQLANSVIRAPAPGLVVYESSRDHDWDERDQIAEGANVRYRQNLIALPNISKMVVNTKIHESEVSRVREGQRAVVRLDSQPEMPYWGTVMKVAILPDSNRRWFSPDSRVYNTQVILDGTNEDLRPGKSSQVEIIIDELENILYVPTQAVTALRGRQVCYVESTLGTEMRDVVVGQSNARFIVIQDGLEEGEHVLLNPPLQPGNATGTRLEGGAGEGRLEDPGTPAEGPPGRLGPEAAPEQLASATDSVGNGNGNGDEVKPTADQMEARRKAMEERMKNMTPAQREEAMKRMREAGGKPREARAGDTAQSS